MSANTRLKACTRVDDRHAVPHGYKRSEVGVIPEDWTVRSLRSCLRSAPGYGINAAAVPFDDSLPTYLRITDISEDNRFRPSPRVSVRHPNAEAFFLCTGDLVFARTGASVGKSYLYDLNDGPLVFAGFLIRVSPNLGQLQPSFLAYCVQSKRYWDWVASVSTRSGQPGINGQQYGTFELPLPELSEQGAIAQVLSDVDALLGALETLIAKKRAIKQATTQQLLTGQLRLPQFERTARIDLAGLGTLPADWAIVPLKDACLKIQDGTHFSPALGGSDYLYVTSRSIGFGTLNVSDADTISEEEHRKIYTRCDTRSGDLLLTKDGANTGNAALNTLRDECSLLSSVAFLRFDPRRDDARFFLQYILSNPAQRRLKEMMSGNAITRLTLQKINSFRVPRPSLEEQQAIATVLSDMDAEIAALERRRDKTQTIKQGMMQQLLTGRVRLVDPAQAVAST